MNNQLGVKVEVKDSKTTVEKNYHITTNIKEEVEDVEVIYYPNCGFEVWHDGTLYVYRSDSEEVIAQFNNQWWVSASPYFEEIEVIDYYDYKTKLYDGEKSLGILIKSAYNTNTLFEYSEVEVNRLIDEKSLFLSHGKTCCVYNKNEWKYYTYYSQKDGKINLPKNLLLSEDICNFSNKLEEILEI